MKDATKPSKDSKDSKDVTGSNGAKPSKADAKALFQTYQGCQDAVERAEQVLEAAKIARSGAVQTIKEALGSGPFSWRGQTVSVSSRGVKNPDGTVGAVGYFFKGIGGAVQEIG